ncbi:MAG: nucleotidyl transferase AbiEii/AbiGii toxin family protein [archaeon]
MISIDEIKKIARLKGINTLGNAEKDYLLDIALLSISRNTKDELIFKGGTCLSKFHKLDRFSEDIDFTLKKDIDIENLAKKIIRDFSSFGIEAQMKAKKIVRNSTMITIRTKGPLYTGTPQSYSCIRIDINHKSEVNLEPKIKKYISSYPDIPSFTLITMQKKEILSEKIRAIMTRSKARDIYDLWFLLELGTEIDTTLIKEKLKYYKEKWDKDQFIKRLDIKEIAWQNELKPLITRVPDLKDTKDTITGKLKQA